MSKQENAGMVAARDRRGERGVRGMMARRNIGVSLAGLLATSALCVPTIARGATPAPDFVDVVDANGVDLVSGLPIFTIDEGGIGSGPGAVRMEATWAEGAGLIDNWSGGLYVYQFITKMRTNITKDGRTDTFIQQTDGSWSNRWLSGGTLTTDASGYYIYTEKDGTQIKFDNNQTGSSEYSCPGSSGAVCHVPVSIIRPNGLKFILGWEYSSTDSTPRLKTVSSSAGYNFTIAYASNVTSSPDWTKRTSVTFGNSANPPSPAPKILYAYPNSSTTKVTDAAGRTWTLTANASGQLVGVTRPGSTSANVTYSYGADGTVSSSSKDGVAYNYGRVSSDAVTETVTNALLQQMSVTSKLPNLTGTRPLAVTDALQHTTTVDYDIAGRLWHVTAPEGNKATYTYDDRGNITQVDLTSKAGTKTISMHADFDLTCANPKTCNQPNSVTDANGNVTNFDYDPTHGGVTSVTPPSTGTGVQPQTRFSYLPAVTSNSGDTVYMLRKVSACPSAGISCTTANEVSTTLNYFGVLLPSSIVKGNSSGTVTAATAMTYDNRGNLTTVNGPLTGTADTTKYRYDSANQLTGVTSPDPDGASIGQPMRAVKIAYRDDGQVKQQIVGTVPTQSDADWSNNFAALQTLDIGFNTNSRTTTRTLSAGGTAYALTQANYDAAGRPNCIAVRMNTAVYGSLPASACALSAQGSFGPDRVTQYVYDDAGRVTDVKVAVGVTAQAATERHLTYNPNGTVDTLTDAKNNITNYNYDGFDRLITTIYPDATTEKVTLYDDNGNVKTAVNRANQTTTFTYDKLNRLLTKSPAGQLAVTYGWDNLGRLKSATQTGTALSFGYDALNCNVSQTSPQGTLTLGCDAAGRRTSIDYPAVAGVSALTVAYDYLNTGELETISDGATVLATYSYDQLGNRSSVAYGNGTSENYSYDPVSRLTTLSFAGLPSANNLTVGGSTPITYNPAFQITSAKRSDGAGADTYAWTNYSPVTRTHTINNLNQVGQTVSTPGSTITFNYDGKGNLTSDGTNTFAYDAESHLTGLGSTSLSYDPLGRLMQVDATATTKFAYDGLDMIADYNGSSLVNRYVFGPGMDEPIVAYDPSGTRTWLYSDERGSVVASGDATGGILFTNKYDEYGMPPVDTGGNNLNSGRFQYTGQMWLPEVGLYYYKARFYSPTMGRFVQADPIGYYGDGPNLYAYVLNDPVNAVDPLGLCDDDTWVCGKRPSCTEGWDCYSGGGLDGILGQLTYVSLHPLEALVAEAGAPGGASPQSPTCPRGSVGEIKQKLPSKGVGAQIQDGVSSYIQGVAWGATALAARAGLLGSNAQQQAVKTNGQLGQVLGQIRSHPGQTASFVGAVASKYPVQLASRLGSGLLVSMGATPYVGVPVTGLAAYGTAFKEAYNHPDAVAAAVIVGQSCK